MMKEQGNERVEGGAWKGQGRRYRGVGGGSGVQPAFVELLFRKEWGNIWGQFNPSFSQK